MAAAKRVTIQAETLREFRYACHGCSNVAGWFDEPVLNARVTCSNCGMDQLTKLESFIHDPDNAR